MKRQRKDRETEKDMEREGERKGEGVRVWVGGCVGV